MMMLHMLQDDAKDSHGEWNISSRSNKGCANRRGFVGSQLRCQEIDSELDWIAIIVGTWNRMGWNAKEVEKSKRAPDRHRQVEVWLSNLIPSIVPTIYDTSTCLAWVCRSAKRRRRRRNQVQVVFIVDEICSLLCRAMMVFGAVV